MNKEIVWLTKKQKEDLIKFLDVYRAEFMRMFQHQPDSTISAVIKGDYKKISNGRKDYR